LVGRRGDTTNQSRKFAATDNGNFNRVFNRTEAAISDIQEQPVKKIIQGTTLPEKRFQDPDSEVLLRSESEGIA